MTTVPHRHSRSPPMSTQISPSSCSTVKGPSCRGCTRPGSSPSCTARRRASPDRPSTYTTIESGRSTTASVATTSVYPNPAATAQPCSAPPRRSRWSALTTTSTRTLDSGTRAGGAGAVVVVDVEVEDDIDLVVVVVLTVVVNLDDAVVSGSGKVVEVVDVPVGSREETMSLGTSCG